MRHPEKKDALLRIERGTKDLYLTWEVVATVMEPERLTKRLHVKDVGDFSWNRGKCTKITERSFLFKLAERGFVHPLCVRSDSIIWLKLQKTNRENLVFDWSHNFKQFTRVFNVEVLSFCKFCFLYKALGFQDCLCSCIPTNVVIHTSRKL